MGAEVAMVTRVMPSSHDMITIFVPCTLGLGCYKTVQDTFIII